MDEFDAGGQMHVARPGIAAHPRRSEREQGSKPLPAGGDDMGGKLWDQRYWAVHPGDNRAVAGGEVGANKRDQGC